MSSHKEPAGADTGSRDRRTAILEAAGATLLRYGFRKASVDEVAQQAGISRQGLYRHFPTKDDLFAAAIDHLLESTVAAARAELVRSDVPLEDRLLSAFGSILGESLTAAVDEVLETAGRLTGRPAVDLEQRIIAEFTHALEAAPGSSAWHRHGDSPQAVATALYATSAGLKRLVTTEADYLDAMARTIRFVCNP
jgi:AcrR family transcriptional regulator